jgi:hypothetical protein
LLIANTDQRIHDCLRRFGFDVARETTSKSNGLSYLRVRGGLRERLRFFHTTDPAITRKRTITGTALKSDARTQVVSVEPLGVELPLYDITTGTGDFIADGVVSHNCFARPTHKYLDMDPGRDFEREIVVKVNVPEVLRAELARPSWTHEHVAMGTNTDPYQWVEGRYRLMPGIWEALRDAANPCSVLTKSPLVVRDLPLLREVAARTEVTANFSVPTLDEKAWRASEPRTPHPRARLEAVAELNAAGVPTGILVAPLMPGSTTIPARSSGSSPSRPRRGPGASAGSRCTCAARCGGSSSSGCGPTGPTCWTLRGVVPPRGVRPARGAPTALDLLRRPTASGRRPPWRPPPDMRRPGDPAARDPAPEREPGPAPERQRSHGTAARAGSRPVGPGTAAGGRPTAPGGADTRQEVLF